MHGRSSILLLALLSALLWTLAWPAVGGQFYLAFIAWVPLLLAEERFGALPADKRPRHFLPKVYLACFIWNAATTWWLGNVQEPWITRLVSGGFPMTANSVLMVIPWWLRRKVHQRFGSWQADVGFVLFWLTFERLHHDWDLTWPWLTLGNVFAEHPSWIQWYDHTGNLGGSLWVLLVNLLVFRVLQKFRTRSANRYAHAVGLAILVLAPLILSQIIHQRYVPVGTPQEIVVVQPNIDPYTEKFGGVDAIEQLDGMLRLAQEAMTPSTALVVLPETALQENAGVQRSPSGELVLNGLWENSLPASQSVQHITAFLAKHPGTSVLAGMSSAYLYDEGEEHPISARPLGGTDRWFGSYNAAMLVEGDGRAEPYHKSKLVVGVEQMPFEEVLGPLSDMAIDLGGTTGSLGTQEEREVMTTRDGRVKAAPVICYESVFAEHVAAHVRNGATVLVIMTNDAWWGDTPGYKQHLAYGRLRAIETRRDIARSANTGISCFIDQRGEVHQATTWWQPDAVRGEVLANDQLTFFVRHGDILGRTACWSSLILLLITLVRSLLAPRRDAVRG